MRKIQVALLAAGIAAIYIWGKVYHDMTTLHAENAALYEVLATGTATMPPKAQDCGVNACSLAKPKPQTLARKNNNPLNVKAMSGGKVWRGQIGTDKHGHAIFESPEYGIRAASFVLRSYARRHNISTITELVSRFCTATGKTKSQYIRHLCRALDVEPDQKFDLVKAIPVLLPAMAKFECGEELPERFFSPYDVVAHI